MVNIMLVCSAGMSTSAMVKKMQDAAEARSLDATIWAISDADTKNEVGKADVVLLGPQVKFLKDKVQAAAGDKPVDVIEMINFGMMNGDAVLDQALKLIEK